MTLVKRSFFLFLGMFLLVLFSSCGTSGAQQAGSASTNTGAQPTSAVVATATDDTSNGYRKGNGYGTGSTASSPTATSATSTGSITVKSAMVNGKTVTILVNAAGMTLYYFTPDTIAKTVCTAGCASTWPPVLFTSGEKPGATVSLPGSLAVNANANGKQVMYNDHPLYTFSGDSAAGQTNGEGIAGKWFVVTPDLTKNA